MSAIASTAHPREAIKTSTNSSKIAPLKDRILRPSAKR